MSEIYELALNKSVGGILIISEQLRIEFVNDWLAQVLNLPSDSLGKSLAEQLPQTQNPRFLDAVKASLEMGVSARLSTTFESNLLKLKDPLSGESLTHSTYISRLQSQDTNYCLVNIVDETRPLKREQLLADYIQKLKDTEQQLEKSRDIAVKASQAKTEFIASVSHQLRTPLNAIVGFSELLVNGALGAMNDEQLDSVKDIFDSGKLISDFVEQILFISDYSTNTEIDLEPVDVSAELQNLVSQMKAEPLFNQLEVDDIELPETVLQVNRRLLLALLKNLLKITITSQLSHMKVSIGLNKHQCISVNFNGDWGKARLVLEKESGRLMQVTEQLNTEGDMRFYLELSQQLADLAGVKLDFQDTKGLMLVFDK